MTAATTPLILLVEDEAAIRRVVHAALTSASYRVLEAETGAQALRLAAEQPPHLVLLDLGLPDIEGQELLRLLHERLAAPLIILSARNQEQQKIAALDAGADDYLTKPFSTGELLARIRVALRHAARDVNEETSVLNCGDLQIDLSARKVLVAGQEVRLTPTEFELLTTLAQNAGKVLTHRVLLKKIWGAEHVHDNHYLRVYMTALRRKIEADSAQPRYLLTEQGVGYRLATD